MLDWKEQLEKKIEELKGGEDMISAKHALQDYDKIVADTKLSDIQKVLAVGRILVKLLLNIRTNQTGGVTKDDTVKEDTDKEEPRQEK